MPNRSPETIAIVMDSREWSRQFYAVVRSLAKTVTEPITNSDTSYKRKLGLPDCSGLVKKILATPKGETLEVSSLRAQLRDTAPKRTIEVHLYTAKGYDREPRSCDVVDFAEGLSFDELKRAFESYAADKTAVSKGRPGRSLFGRGVSDVLLGHQSGSFHSYKDGVLSRATFSFDARMKKGPQITVEENRKPTIAELRKLHLEPGQNGSCVSVVLQPDCRIPEEGTIIQYLSQFYMLRLINADPNVTVRMVRYRGGKRISKDEFDYDFPVGPVLGKFTSTWGFQPEGGPSFDIGVDGIVCRANVEGELPGIDARDYRANGLLVVDDKDAVLDLTFLPKYERAPYLTKIYGVIRLSNIRSLFEWYLNEGKDSPLKTSRDGFDEKHEASRALFTHLEEHLEPIYRREEERLRRAEPHDRPHEVKVKIDAAIRELNRALRDLAGEGTGGDTAEGRMDAVPLQFLPKSVRLVAGRRRVVKLYLRKEDAQPEGNILLDGTNPNVRVSPLSFRIAEGQEINEFRVFNVVLQCDNLAQKGQVNALADGRERTLEARLEIEDVLPPFDVAPPESMEFRPKEIHGLPNRRNGASLFVNISVVPLGRKIKLDFDKVHGALSLLQEDKRVSAMTVTLSTEHVLRGGEGVARIVVPWQGTGWGQSGTVVATTKLSDGRIVQGRGVIVIEEPEPEGGFVRDIKYRDLGPTKASDLVDGIIYIGSTHSLNRSVFGPDQASCDLRVKDDLTAQYRYAAIVVEQAVYSLAERSLLENKLGLGDAPITNIRAFIDAHTHQFAPKILKILMAARSES